MNFAKATAAAAALAVSTAGLMASPAMAQAAGDTVMGNDGNPVGTITNVSEQAITIDTGTYEIPLPPASFGEGENGPTLNITQEQLNSTWAEQVAAAEAALAEKLVVGAVVTTYDGQTLGMVEEVNEETAIVDNEGEKYNLPKNVFSLDQQGALQVRLTMAQIEEAMAGQGGAPEAAAAPAE